MLINQGEQQCQWTTIYLVEVICNIVIATFPLLSPTFCSGVRLGRAVGGITLHLVSKLLLQTVSIGCFFLLSMCLNKYTEESLILVDTEIKSLNPPVSAIRIYYQFYDFINFIYLLKGVGTN